METPHTAQYHETNHNTLKNTRGSCGLMVRELDSYSKGASSSLGPAGIVSLTTAQTPWNDP